MTYKRKKFVLIPFIITIMSFYQYGCSQESERETFRKETHYNFLDNLRNVEINTEKANNSRKGELTINYFPREVLYQHQNSELTFKDVPIYEDAELKFGIGIDPAMWDREGSDVLFEINVVGENSQNILLFSKYVDPKNNVKDRGWLDEKIDLGALAGQKISFIFKTTSSPTVAMDSDWAGWSNPQLTGVKTHEVTLIDFGTLDARRYIQEGWSIDQKGSDGATYVWSEGEKSTLEFFLSEARNIQMTFRCRPFQFPDFPDQTISFILNGKEIEQVTLKPGPPAEYQIILHNQTVIPGKNRLEFRYKYACAPKDVIPGSVDIRQLGVSWDYIRLAIPLGEHTPVLSPVPLH